MLAHACLGQPVTRSLRHQFHLFFPDIVSNESSLGGRGMHSMCDARIGVSMRRTLVAQMMAPSIGHDDRPIHWVYGATLVCGHEMWAQVSCFSFSIWFA